MELMAPIVAQLIGKNANKTSDLMFALGAVGFCATLLLIFVNHMVKDKELGIGKGNSKSALK